MLDDQINEQKMTLDYNKKKLWKTQLGVAFLLLITLIHVATYREVKSELDTLVKEQTEILDSLEKKEYFKKISMRIKSEKIEIRL